jgi:flagellar L-ring protein precursor FlgH
MKRLRLRGRSRTLWATLIILAVAAPAEGQTSSLYLLALKRRQSGGASGDAAAQAADRNAAVNPELEVISPLAVQTPSPDRFRVHDLITVVVREQKDYRTDARLKTEHDWDVESNVDEFFKFVDGHLGAATFSDGHPNIDYEWNTEFDTRGDSQRKDSLTFRIAVEIIDIKPNGLLVLSGNKRIEFDEDVQTMTITGVCRAMDITPDNTVLSSQVHDQFITVKHDGPMRDSGKRGWIVKLLDWLGPF